MLRNFSGILASVLFLLAGTAIGWFLGSPNFEIKGVLSFSLTA
jgi:hypothetical protein